MYRNKNKSHQAMGTIMILVIIDQVTKILAKNILVDNSLELIPGFFNLTLAFNSGAAFSMLQNGRLFFILLTPIVLIIAWRYYQKYIAASNWFYWGGILFFTGTLGNFLDRLFYGKVTDFLSFIFGNYYFPIFNIADMFLSISVPVILIAVYLYEKKQVKEQLNNE